MLFREEGNGTDYGVSPDVLDNNILINDYSNENTYLLNGSNEHKTPLITTNHLITGHSNGGIERTGTYSDTEHPLYNLFFQPIKHGSLKTSIFCMICVTLGTGMLPLPYFFKSNGIILTLVVFLICGASTYITLKILISLAYKNATYNYNELVSKYYGKKMTAYAIVVLLINSFGSIIMWNVFISKFAKDILNYFNTKVDTDVNVIYLSIAILVFVQIPLAWNNTGTEFDIMSTIGILQILYVITVLFIEFPDYATRNFSFSHMSKRTTYFNFNYKMIEMPFVFFIAFGNHSTILSVIDEIKNKNADRVTNVGKRTFYAEVFIYIVIFFVSYFSTFNKTEEIFLVRPHLSLLMMLGELFMLLLMICNISLYYFTTYPTLELLLNDGVKFSEKQNFLAAFTVLTILMMISFYVDSIISMLSFIGIVAQVSLIFIIPISIYIKDKENEFSTWQKVKYILFLSFFTFLGVGGFCFMIYNQFMDNN